MCLQSYPIGLNPDGPCGIKIAGVIIEVDAVVLGELADAGPGEGVLAVSTRLLAALSRALGSGSFVSPTRDGVFGSSGPATITFRRIPAKDVGRRNVPLGPWEMNLIVW